MAEPIAELNDKEESPYFGKLNQVRIQWVVYLKFWNNR